MNDLNETPTVPQQIKAVRLQLQILVRSYTDIVGHQKGRIRSVKIRREVEALRAAINRLAGQKTFDAAIRQLRARIVRVGREHSACCRQIKALEARKWCLFYESKRLWKIVDAAESDRRKK